MGAIKLHDYQEVASDFICNHPHCMLALPMGFGKTVTTLETFNRIMPSGHILVVAPLNIVRSTWLDEIDKWGFNVRTRSLITNTAGRQLSRSQRLRRYAEAMAAPPTMYFINQELIHDLVEYAQHRNDPKMTIDLIEYLRTVLPEETVAPIAKLVSGRDDADVIADVIKALQAPATAGTPTRNTLKLMSKLGSLNDDQIDEEVAKLDRARSYPDDLRSAVKYLLTQMKADADTSFAVDCVHLCLQTPIASEDLIEDLRGFSRTWHRVNKQKMHDWTWPFQTIVLDESQGLKNPSSRRFKAMRKVRPAVTRLIELTGTPTPQGLLDLWSQVYLLDQGQALGKSMREYRERWFYPTRYVDNRPVQWEPRDGAKFQIYDSIKSLVMSVENNSVKMPDVVLNDVKIHLDPEEMATYRRFADTAVLELTDDEHPDADLLDTIIASNAGVLSAKLTQFASGTIYTEPDKHEFIEIHSKKIEMADYILRNTNSPVIIAYRFVSDRIRLKQQLRDMGHDAHVFDGSRQMVADWNAGKIPVMILQPASAGHGLNLQDGGHTIIWYTLPVSLEHYLQTNARVARQGQKNTVTIHRLITAGTYDARIPGILSGKNITQQDLIESVRHEIADLNNPFISTPSFSDDDDIGFDVGQLL